MYTDAFERKLGPIYGAIETQNYKATISSFGITIYSYLLIDVNKGNNNGLKLTEAALRKYSKSQLLRALKAFCSAKLQKQQIAESILSEIVREGPEDDRVLHTLTFVYKALGMKENMLEAYQAAANKKPNDVDIRIGLFGCYVRYMSYINQQQEAFKLVKLDPEHADMYTWWSSCEAMRASMDMGDSVAQRLLKLAESMIEQRRRKDTSEKLTYEQLMMLFDILCGLEKMNEAVEMAQVYNDICKDDLPEMERNILIGAMLVRSGGIGEAAGYFKTAAIRNPEDWLSLHWYIICKLPESILEDLDKMEGFVYPLRRIDGGIAELWDTLKLPGLWRNYAERIGTSLEARVQEVDCTLLQMKDLYAENKHLERSISLASLELARRKMILKHEQYAELYMLEIQKHLPILSQYSSFSYDMREICRIFGREEKQKVIQLGASICRETWESLSDQETTLRTQQQVYMQKINAEMLTYECGFEENKPLEDLVSSACNFMSLYFSHQDLFKDLDPKERGLGEELLVLAIIPLIKAMKLWKTKELGRVRPFYFLFFGLLSIEAAQVQRKVSAPLRLASSALYGLLGADSLASKQFASLDIKGVLHDSLTGHWILPMLMAACCDKKLYHQWFSGLSNLHTVQEMEAREALYTAYEQCTYTKIPEFVDFIHCLRDSAARALHLAEADLLEITEQCVQQKLSADLRLTANPVLKSDLKHNCDLTVRPLWYPPCPFGPDKEVLWWWCTDQEDVLTSDGFSGVWWSRQISPDILPIEAKLWQQRTSRAIRCRQLMAHIVKDLMDSDIKCPDFSFINTWLSMKEIPGISVESKVMLNETNYGGSRVEFMSLLRQCDDNSLVLVEKVSVGLVIASFEVQCCGLGNSTVDYCRSCIVSFKEILSVACKRCIQLMMLASDKESDDKCLPFPGNEGLALAARFAKEDFVWIVSLIKHWMRCSRKGGPWEALANVRSDIQDVAVQLCNDLQTILDCIGLMIPDDTHGTASSVLSTMESEFPDLCQWGREPKFDAVTCLQKMMDSQSETLNRISKSFQSIIKPLEVYKIE
eukprot:jgi/Picsp_1/818/NSC_04307-R1_tetratricopeptide repeat-containing protein